MALKKSGKKTMNTEGKGAAMAIEATIGRPWWLLVPHAAPPYSIAF